MRSWFFTIAVAASICCCPASAANLTVLAEGVLTDFFDPDGLLPFAEPEPGTVFLLQFTYDDAASDEVSPGDPDESPRLGLYGNAVQSLHLEIAGQTYGQLPNTFLIVADDLDQFLPNPLGEAYDAWGLETRRRLGSGEDNTVSYESISFILQTRSLDTPIDVLDSDDLIPPFGPSPWSIAEVSYLFYSVNTDTNIQTIQAEATAAITSIAVVPVPQAAFLFGSALWVLGFFRGRYD